LPYYINYIDPSSFTLAEMIFAITIVVFAGRDRSGEFLCHTGSVLDPGGFEICQSALSAFWAR